MFTDNDNKELTITRGELWQAVQAALELDGFASVRRSMSEDYDCRAFSADVTRRMLAELENKGE